MSLPVFIKVLKAKDVQNTNTAPKATGRFVDGLVDLVNNPDEHASIDALYKSIADIQCCHGVHGGCHTLSLCKQRARCQCIYQVLCSHLKTLVITVSELKKQTLIIKLFYHDNSR